MKKNFGIVAILVFVLSFGGLVFAQNSNTSTNTANTSTGMAKHRKSRKHRKARRRHRRGGSKKTAAPKNANM